VVFEAVCTDLEGEGYEVRPFNIPAAGVGAPHRRERIWIIANRKESMVNSDDVRLEQYSTTKEKASWWRTSTTFEPTGSADMENARRTLRPGTELREKNEDEIERKDAHQHQRSGSPSEPDVANANGGRSHEQNNEIQTGRNVPISSSEDVADTDERNVEAGRERHRGIRTTNQGPGQPSDAPSSSEVMANTNLNREKWNQSEDRNGSRTQQGSEDVANTKSSDRNDDEAVAGNGEPTTQEVSGDGSRVRGESAWWDFEPDVGRVAHGVSGRVYRLKALGNSIIPQIAQEIGNAIIKAEGEK